MVGEHASETVTKHRLKQYEKQFERLTARTQKHKEKLAELLIGVDQMTKEVTSTPICTNYKLQITRDSLE